jgi:hypothetical protein
LLATISGFAVGTSGGGFGFETGGAVAGEAEVGFETGGAVAGEAEVGFETGGAVAGEAEVGFKTGGAVAGEAEVRFETGGGSAVAGLRKKISVIFSPLHVPAVPPTPVLPPRPCAVPPTPVLPPRPCAVPKPHSETRAVQSDHPTVDRSDVRPAVVIPCRHYSSPFDRKHLHAGHKMKAVRNEILIPLR